MRTYETIIKNVGDVIIKQTDQGSDLTWVLTISDWINIALALFTFLAILAAIRVPYIVESLRKKSLRSNLSGKGVQVFPQELSERRTDYYGRLVILNESNNAAVNVEAVLESIEDESVPREGFLPVPLTWTHSRVGEVHKTISGNQPVYLDIFSFEPDHYERGKNDPYRKMFRVATRTTNLDLFDRLYFGETILHIVLYQSSGQVVRLNPVIISWDEYNTPPKILYIK